MFVDGCGTLEDFAVKISTSWCPPSAKVQHASPNPVPMDAVLINVPFNQLQARLSCSDQHKIKKSGNCVCF